MKKTLRNDLILIAVLLLAGLIALGVSRRNAPKGEVAVVRVEDRVIGRYPLSVDGEFPLNGGTNVLVIEDGTARIDRADCPDKICVNQGRVRRGGQIITCLPNRLTVTIEGGSPGGPDLVS